jgi:hypothetical protein
VDVGVLVGRMEGVCKMDWIGLDWIGLDWIGLDWIGLDWMGLDWMGLDWMGLEVLTLMKFVRQMVFRYIVRCQHLSIWGDVFLC